MRALFFFIGFFCCLSLQAQVYIGKETDISFFSKSTIEDISAHNKNVKPVFNTSTGDLIIKIPNTGFTFKSALMQEHFNENYMESDKYPVASFSGKIIEDVDFSKDGTYEVRAKGTLTIHGVSQERIIKGNVTVNNKKITITANFSVLLSDHNIPIPIVVYKKLANEIKVEVSTTLEPR